MSALVLAGVEIHQDKAGRFSLNDFHRAAGSESRHRPSIWLDNQQAKDLVAELEAENPASKPVGTLRGRGVTGTYTCKELVYAYAMWISPSFHLKVIRTFDAVVSPASELRPEPVTNNAAAVEFGKLALQHLPNLGESSKQALLSELSVLSFGQRLIPLPKVEAHLMPATEVGEKLGISKAMVGRLANANGLKVPEYGEFRLDKASHSSKQVESFFYNAAGLERLRQILAEKSAA